MSPRTKLPTLIEVIICIVIFAGLFQSCAVGIQISRDRVEELNGLKTALEDCKGAKS